MTPLETSDLIFIKSLLLLLLRSDFVGSQTSLINRSTATPPPPLSGTLLMEITTIVYVTVIHLYTAIHGIIKSISSGEYKSIIGSIEIYPEDSVVHLCNNWILLVKVSSLVALRNLVAFTVFYCRIICH